MPQDEFRYEQLARALETLIEQGVYRAGDRLPSIRALARDRRLSVATVVQALHRLEARGLIEARPQSGCFVRPRRSIREPEAGGRAALPAVPVRVSERIIALQSRPGFARFGPAVPAAPLLPLDELGRSFAAAARQSRTLLVGTGYDAPIDGALARQIVRRSLRWGDGVDPSELVATQGCVEALSLALQATTRPGDTVAVESPGYYLMLELLESMGLRALEIPGDARTGLSLEALEAALAEQPVAALLLSANASNPLGATMPEARKARLAATMAARGIPVIEDDIVGELHFDGERPRPVKAFDEIGNVLWCGSFSKTLSPQLRLGWIAAGRHRERVGRLKQLGTGASAPLPQRAVAHYLGSGRYERHLRGMRSALAEQAARLRDAVAAAFPEGTRVSRPAGGLVLWVELPGGPDTSALLERAIGEGIAFVPGELFSARAAFRDCLRLSFGEPWSVERADAIRRLGALAGAMLACENAARPPGCVARSPALRFGG